MKQTLSVLITVYDGDNLHHFEAALWSTLVNQTRTPDEVILVVDGSVNSDFNSVINKFSTLVWEKLKVIRFSKNRGLAVALNAGLSECKCDWVARMDSDDISLPRRFETQLSFLKSNTTVDILGSSAYEIDFLGFRTGERLRKGGDAHIKRNLWANPLIHSSVVFSRRKILSIGGYNSKLRFRQDYDLWFRAAEEGLIFENIKEPLICYRFDRATLVRQTPARAFEQAMIGYRGAKNLRYPRWKAFLCFLPFVRVLFPLAVQLKLIELFKKIDPR